MPCLIKVVEGADDRCRTYDGLDKRALQGPLGNREAAVLTDLV